MPSNCSLETHSVTLPSPWMPLAAALHLMARLSGRYGGRPRQHLGAKKIESSSLDGRGGSKFQSSLLWEYPPRRKVRGDAKMRVATRSGSNARDLLRVTHRPAEVRVTRAGASPAVFGESCVAAIVVVCAGGSLRAVEGSGRWSPRDFGESSGGWSACGRATRVYRSDAGPVAFAPEFAN